MKIVCDRHIPFLADAIQNAMPEVHICPMESEEIDTFVLQDADALFIRTRTKVNRDLLEGTKVQFVATATIGYDHIDTAYCDEIGVKWVSCPGCNAQAVCDYVEAAIDYSATDALLMRYPTLGIIGYGHIGSLVAQMAARKGLKVLVNDPPKNLGVTIDEIEEKSDFITFHAPLSFNPNPYPTYHLCDASFLSHCKPEAIIINAARGGIIDEKALLHSGHRCVIDCWENEPDINTDLLLSPQTILASCHIAGYSLDGKINATQMCLDAFCLHFGLAPMRINRRSLQLSPEMTGDSADGWLQRVSQSLKSHPAAFEQLRKNYRLR